MSSGENIEIGIGADSSGLIEALEKVAANLKSLEKVLAGVSGGFENAGDTAEKAMGEAEKAADKAADAVGGLGKKTQEWDQKAKEAGGTFGETFDNVADQAGRADSALSGLAATMDHFGESGQRMAAMARQAADAAGGVEQLMLAMRQAPFVVGTALVAIGSWEALMGDTVEIHERIIQTNEQISNNYDGIAQKIRAAVLAQDEFNHSMDMSVGIGDQVDVQLRARMSQIDAISRLRREEARLIRNNSRLEADAAEDAIALQTSRLQTGLAYWEAIIVAQMDGVEAVNMLIEHHEEQDALERQRNTLREESARQRAQEYQTTMRQIADEREANVRLAEEEENRNRILEDRIDRLNQLSALTVISQARQEEAFSWWGTATQTMGTTVEVVDEASGAFVVLQDGLRATEEQFSLLQQQHVASNQVFAQGSDSVERQAALVEELNTLLGHEDERYRALTDHMVGMDVAHGALNMVTMQAIDVNELYGLVLEERNRVAIEAAQSTQSLTDATSDDTDALEDNVEAQRAFLSALNDANIALSESFESEGIQRVRQYQAAVAAVETEAVKLGLSLDHPEIIENLSGLAKGLAVDLNEINSIEVDEDPFLGPLESALRAQEALGEQRMFLRAMEEEDALLRQQYLIEAELQRKENHEAQADRLADMEQIIADHHQAVSDMEAEAAEERAQRLADVFEENIQGIGGLAGALSDVFEERADGLGEDNMAQAQRAFEISKALAIAEITVNTAAAIMSVVSQAKSVTGAAARVIAIGALGAVQMAQVKKQDLSFHSGGIVPESDPSETSATLLPGEAVLNRSAVSMLGQSGVSQINSGMMPGSSSQLVAVETYKHFDRFVGDEYRRQGTLFNLFRKNSEGTFGQRGY
jgi:hypothetical protein